MTERLRKRRWCRWCGDTLDPPALGTDNHKLGDTLGSWIESCETMECLRCWVLREPRRESRLKQILFDDLATQNIDRVDDL